MVLKHWQDQYALMGTSVSQSVSKPLEVLEHIKRAFPTEKECEGPKASTTRGGSSKKRMVAFSNQIPKTSRKEAKHCALCKNHGDMQNTHTTGECHKYEKDGTLKRAFARKSAQLSPHNRHALHEHNTSYV
jgi:hypothetical protein